jgi:hypothetical protein
MGEDTPETEHADRKEHPLLSKSWFLGLVPFLGYILVFAYEVGILSAFGVPLELVQLDLPHIFLNTFGSLTLICAVYILFIFFYKVFYLAATFLHWPGSVLMGIKYFLLLAACGYFVCSEWVEAPFVGAAVLLLVVNVFVDALLGFFRPNMAKGGKSATRIDVKYAVAMCALIWMFGAGSIRPAVWCPALLFIVLGITFDVSGTQRTPFWLVAGGLFLMLLSLVFMYGNLAMYRSKTWLIPKADTNAVVVRIYQNTVICAPVVWSNRNTVKHSFFLIETSGATNEFEWRGGKLTFEEPARLKFRFFKSWSKNSKGSTNTDSAPPLTQTNSIGKPAQPTF